MPQAPQGPQGPSQDPNQAQDPQQPQQGGDDSQAEQLVDQVHEGLMGLAKMMDQAGNVISPQEKRQLHDIINSFQALVGSLGGEEGQEDEQGPSQPMPANASKNSKPANY